MGSDVDGRCTWTVNCVGTGMLLALSSTGTRVPVPTGSVASGIVDEPVGTGGNATPAMEAMRRLGALMSGGVLVGVTPVGAPPKEYPGVATPPNTPEANSILIRPLCVEL